MSLRGRNWLIIAIVLAIIVSLRVVSSRPMTPTAYFEGEQPLVVARIDSGAAADAAQIMETLRRVDELRVDVLEIDITSSEGTGIHLGKASSLQPTLADVFAEFPGRRFNLVIADDDPAIATVLCDLIRTGPSLPVLVVSAHAGTLRVFRTACPEVATAATGVEVALFMVHHYLGLIRLYRPNAHVLRVPLEAYGVSLVSETIVRDAARRGMAVQATNISDEREMARLVALSVGGIVTDRPEVLLRLVDR